MGCKEKGLGNCYQCEDAENCEYRLHQKCCDLSESGCSSLIFTFLKSKKCDFVFQKEAVGGGHRGCDACGKEVKGWFYKCKICKKPHYLHPCCAHLPIKLQEGKKEEIVLYLKAKTSSTCQQCKMENVALGVNGWFYVSNCGKHCYHIGCVMDMAMESFNKDNDGDDDDNDDDHPYLIKEAPTDHRKKSCSRQTGAIRKIGRPKLDMKKFLTGAAKLVISIIISAIFGVPLTDVGVAFYRLF